MTHSEALAEISKHREESEAANKRCSGGLTFERSVFHSDVFWEVYFCPTCYTEVYTVEGRIHWWNYTKEIKPENQLKTF